jgi:hypothetical protein
MQHIINCGGDNSMLFKKLECANLNEINQEILTYIDSLTFDHDQFWNTIDTAEFVKANPKLKSWLLENKLPVKSIAITRGTHPGCCGPHTDTPPSRIKLSWPILNTEHTWNRWFQPLPNAVKQVNTLGGISYVKPDQLIEIDRMRVEQPALIVTDVPHDVWFESDAKFPRWGLQCQLFLEPDHL